MHIPLPTYGLAMRPTIGISVPLQAVVQSSTVARRHILLNRAAATESDPVKCSVCEYEIVPALGHTHAYGTEWKSDKDNHWNECACGDKVNTAAHKDENKDGKCDVCAYDVGVPTTPTDPSKPSDDVQSPQTGDNSNISALFALMLGSLAAMCVILFCTKKKRHAENK